jgi:hypothetical protein
VQERISRLIRPRPELLALLALSVLVDDRNGSGVPIHHPSIHLVVRMGIHHPGIPLLVRIGIHHPSIPLVVRMGNLTMKGKTMLNTLLVRYYM